MNERRKHGLKQQSIDATFLSVARSLVFYNEEIGEFWYELNLVSTDPSTVDLGAMSAPLGG